MDVFVLSYPKCGRTWLRLMIGFAISRHFNVRAPDLLAVERLTRDIGGAPVIAFTHDDAPHRKPAANLSGRKTHYRGRKVALLVRDPRDVLVSLYFELTRRERRQQMELSAFIRDPRYGVDNVIRWYNIWAQNRDVPAAFSLFRYEDLRADTSKEVQRLLDLAGLGTLSAEIVRDAVEFARFERMRQLEVEAAFAHPRLRPADPNDPESFKTRRGKVGGYVDYLAPEDIAFLNRRIRTDLADIFGYAG